MSNASFIVAVLGQKQEYEISRRGTGVWDDVYVYVYVCVCLSRTRKNVLFRTGCVTRPYKCDRAWLSEMIYFYLH